MYHSTFQFTFSSPKWEMLLVLLWSTKLYNEPRTTNTITEPRWCGAINSAPSPTKWILCVLTIEAPLYCHWSETSTSSPHPRSSNYQDKVDSCVRFQLLWLSVLSTTCFTFVRLFSRVDPLMSFYVFFSLRIFCHTYHMHIFLCARVHALVYRKQTEIFCHSKNTSQP